MADTKGAVEHELTLGDEEAGFGDKPGLEGHMAAEMETRSLGTCPVLFWEVLGPMLV